MDRNNNKTKNIINEEKEILAEEKKVLSEARVDGRSNKANYILSASILIAAVLISCAVFYSKGTGVANPNQGGAAVKPGDNSDAFVIKKDDIILGNSNAPVTIFLYSDPSCPFCAAAAGYNQQVISYLKKQVPTWTAPIPGIIDNYVKTGKASLIYRYYPGHGSGEQAMKILYCANEQGKFWDLENAIFDHQSDVADATKVKALAAGVGADVSKINSCLDSKKYDYKIASDTDLGTKAGVNGTPGFFINKVSKAGAYPFSDFQQLIDSMLQGK